ncbi:toll/interleukin-1 receptor domain-containing protein [Flavobacterium weaverense]|uniref:TIR domain-containing protein n=1 Tax=Flavobacterium weaverense TaxID=271156 RepID=A0A3L9ZXZ1_9FLAO|nr:toll/interleukin-1 receptor domain-containing protein [Flavobacterium weaverense]RMA77751.1 TIR domain-containing protein [Flavobacterium weaverense]
MKIFISHASANKEYGDLFVELLRGIGLNEHEIVYTSNVAYGIPIGQNIFSWLKSQIIKKPFVLYLLSKEYYSSVACLNEMGAAWIVENEHAVIFKSNFDVNSKEFQNGALDPRKIGFRINDEDRLLSFIHQLGSNFTISKNSVIINQRLKYFLSQIKLLEIEDKSNNESFGVLETPNGVKTKQNIENENDSIFKPQIIEKKIDEVRSGIYPKFVDEIIAGKLKDEELILLSYIIETSKVKLMTGWQEENELRSIKEWERTNKINKTLYNNYGAVIRRFDLRGYTEVSAVTSGGNPKEVKLKDDIESNILDLPKVILDLLDDVLNKYKVSEAQKENDVLPF